MDGADYQEDLKARNRESAARAYQKGKLQGTHANRPRAGFQAARVLESALETTGREVKLVSPQDFVCVQTDQKALQRKGAVLPSEPACTALIQIADAVVLEVLVCEDAGGFSSDFELICTAGNRCSTPGVAPGGQGTGPLQVD